MANPEVSEKEAEVLAIERQKIIDEQQGSLDVYEKRVKMYTERVTQETAVMEEELQRLKELAERSQSDPMVKVADYPNQPLPKKMLLAAAILFFARGGADSISGLTSGDLDTFLVPAVAQLGISGVALAAYLLG